MIKLFYNNCRNIIRTIYFIPLEGGWVSITVSVLGSLILLPIVTVIILLTHIIKLFDMIWVKLSYLNCKERNLLLEPLNDVDYLMWRTRTFGQPLIMCFFVTDHLPAELIIRNLVWRIENKDAFRGSVQQRKKDLDLRDTYLNKFTENKRFFCTVESSLGRLWFKYINNDYNTSDNIIKVSPVQARYILNNPHLILDQNSDKTLTERLMDHNDNIKLQLDTDSLTETEMRRFYSILFSCEGVQLSVKRPCWRIIILDNVFWKGTKSSVVIGQFHHVIGDGSTLTEFVTKTVLDFPDLRNSKVQLNGVTKSAKFWHRWVSGLLWAAIAGPITLLKAALQARPERSWNSPTKRRSKRSNKVSFSGPVNIPLSEVTLLKNKLNDELNFKPKVENNKEEFTGMNDTRRRKNKTSLNEQTLQNRNKKERVQFSKRITFNDIILSCVASGYTKYVNYYITNHDITNNNSSSSTGITTPTSGYSIQSNVFDQYIPNNPLISTPKIKKDNEYEKETCLSSPIHFDDKSPYSSILKYDSISGSYDMDHILDLQIQAERRKQFFQTNDEKEIYESKKNNISNNKENDLSTLCHSNLNIVVTTNNRTKPPTKLDNAFSTIVLPIPTCPKATPSERLKCVFESLQEYRKTSLPIIFIRYVQYTLSLSPFALLCLWVPHSRSCSMYYSSVPGPKECSFINKNIKDMTFALPLTDHIGLGLSIFTFEDQVSVSITYDEDIIINPDLLLESIKLSFNELKSGVLSIK